MKLRTGPAQSVALHSSMVGAFTVTVESIIVKNVTRKRMRKNE